MNRISWLHLALLTALATSVLPDNLSWAQRNDDADSLPENRSQNAEPPRLMRGGIMQQLRSVTESVMGTAEDKQAEKNYAARARSSNIPSPPPLGTQRRQPSQPTEDALADEPVARNPAPRPAQPGTNPAQSRAWAGQFLIPNYRLRDQVGTKPSKTQTTAKRSPSRPSDSVEMNLADSGEPAAASTSGPQSRKPQGPPAPPRVYLGQRSPAGAEMNDDVLEDQEDMPTVPPTERRQPPKRTAQLPKPPANVPEAVNVQLSDDASAAPTNENPATEESGEVLVSHVPDIPYVPRKPVPKRERSKLLENTLKAQESSATTQRSTSPVATPQPTPTSSTVPTPAASKPATSSTLPALPLPPSTQPSSLPINDPPSLSPSIPSLELSKDSASAKSDSAKLAAQPTLPSPPPDAPTMTPVPKRTLAPAHQPETQPAKVANIPSPPKSTLPPPQIPANTHSTTSTPSLSLPSAPTSDLVATPPALMPTPPSLVPTPPTLPAAPTLPPEPPTSLAATPTLPQPTSTPTSTPTTTPVATPSSSLKLPAQTVSTPANMPLPAGPSTTAAPPAITSTPIPSRSATQKSTTNIATKPATPPPVEPAPVNNTRMQMEIPHVQVKLLGPGDLTAGTPTTYELQVQNNDRISLSGLILRMETPAGIEVTPTVIGANSADTEKASDGSTMLTWNVSQITAGGQARLPLQLKAQTARNFAVAIEWTVLPQSGLDEIVVKQADLQVALEGPVEVERNAANAYRVRVSNPGSAPARNVKLQVTAGPQPNSQVEVGDLAPGQSEVIDMDLTIEKAGQVSIGVQAAAFGDLNRTANINVNVRHAVLVAAISLPQSVPHGSPVLANIELSNTGDAIARKLQAGVALPAGTQIGQLPAGVSRQGDKLLWDIEQVPPGQLVTIPIELVMPTPGNHELSFACVTGDGAVTTTAATINVEAFADLKLLVNDPASPAPVGSPVTYELTITNRGSREARGLVIVAQFSDGIEPESASGLGHRLVPGQVLFETLPQIEAGQSVTLKVVARATTGGVHRFRAEVRCDETEARLVEEESTRFLDAPGRVATQPSTTLQR